jgi:hypothetical protein
LDSFGDMLLTAYNSLQDCEASIEKYQVSVPYTAGYPDHSHDGGLPRPQNTATSTFAYNFLEPAFSTIYNQTVHRPLAALQMEPGHRRAIVR